MADSRSHLFQIARTDDGATLLWIMAIAGAAIVLDVLINDWTPDSIRIGAKRFRLVWESAFKKRHLLFVILAFCYAAQPFVAAKAGHGVTLLVFFYWNTFQNLAIAILDAKQRSRSLMWQRAYS